MAIPADILSAVKTLIRYEPVNLLLNPGFETSDFTNWANLGSPSGSDALTVDSGTKHAGSYSYKLLTAGDGTDPIGKQQAVTVQAGQPYVLSGYINVSAYSAGNVVLDAQGTGLDTSGISLTATNGGFTEYRELFTVPAGTTSINIRAFMDTSPNATAFFDALVLERGGPETFITDIYERVLEGVCQRHVWWAEREDIDAVLDQSIYTMQARGVRPLAIVHNKIALEKATAWGLDQQSNTWQTDASGTPLYWLFDQIPAALDALSSVTSDQFAVHPAPDANGSGEEGLYVFQSAVPASFEPTLTWADHFLALKTASEVLRQNVTDRYLDMEGDNVQLAQFYGQAADIWEGILSQLIPR